MHEQIQFNMKYIWNFTDERNNIFAMPTKGILYLSRYHVK